MKYQFLKEYNIDNIDIYIPLLETNNFNRLQLFKVLQIVKLF